MVELQPVSFTNDDKQYYRVQYSTIPISDNKVEYTVKKGDNIWKIAKKQLGKNASKAQVSDLMYQIAKLNNKKTIEEANKLSINEVIYLPSSANEDNKTQTKVKADAQHKQSHISQVTSQSQSNPQSYLKPHDETSKFLKFTPQEFKPTWQINQQWKPSSKKQVNPKKQTKPQKQSKPQVQVKPQVQTNPKPSAAQTVDETAAKINNIIRHPDSRATYTEKILYKEDNISRIPASLYTQHGRAGANYWSSALKDEKNTFYETLRTYGSTPSGLYIVKKDGNLKSDKTIAAMIVMLDKKGNIQDISFDSPKADIHSTYFDYTIDARGRLLKKGEFGQDTVIGQLSQQEFNNLKHSVQQQIDAHMKK